MKKLSILLIAMMCIILAACGHEHTWQAANCTSPKLCTSCGETEGEALGHSWIDATCEKSSFCSVCGLTSGDPLGHTWKDATCTDPATCEACGKTQGDPNGHSFTDATCTEPETCSVCGHTQGDALGHTVTEWTVSKDSTCTEVGTETGTCTVCSETATQQIPMKEHTPSDWIVVVQPTPDEEGTRTKNCTVCEKELEREQFTLTAEEMKQLYIKNCKSIAYTSLERTPGEYEGEYVKFSGYVVQVCSEASSALYYSTYRVATSGRYNNVVYLVVDNYGSGTRILEDDYITFYGTFDGLYTYTTVRGDQITIPKVMAEYVD